MLTQTRRAIANFYHNEKLALSDPRETSIVEFFLMFAMIIGPLAVVTIVLSQRQRDASTEMSNQISQCQQLGGFAHTKISILNGDREFVSCTIPPAK